MRLLPPICVQKRGTSQARSKCTVEGYARACECKPFKARTIRTRAARRSLKMLGQGRTLPTSALWAIYDDLSSSSSALSSAL
jgi:hypothetical protein